MAYSQPEEYYYPGGYMVSKCSISRVVGTIDDDEWEQMKVNADEAYREWLESTWWQSY